MNKNHWLYELTKEELVKLIIKSPSFIIKPPAKSSVLFNIWDKEMRTILEMREKSSAMLNSIDAVKRDEIAKRFNAERDLDKKMQLFEQLKPFEDKYKAYLEFERLIAEQEKKADQAYKKYEEARKTENLELKEGTINKHIEASTSIEDVVRRC